jgi:hypothetical protein
MNEKNSNYSINNNTIGNVKQKYSQESNEILLSERVKFSVLVIDNFFENPYEVRNCALQQEYSQASPGIRTCDITEKCNYTDKLQNIIKHFYKICRIKQTVFHVMTSCDLQWIHTDVSAISKTKIGLSAIIYLTPDPYINSGTALYKKNLDGSFDKIIDIGNIFNRMVIFDIFVFHKPTASFGDNITNGRLSMNILIECETI